MGDFKDINDIIFDKLIERLEYEGYEDIYLNPSLNNKLVDLIDARYEDSELFEELVNEAIEVIKNN